MNVTSYLHQKNSHVWTDGPAELGNCPDKDITISYCCFEDMGSGMTSITAINSEAKATWIDNARVVIEEGWPTLFAGEFTKEHN